MSVRIATSGKASWICLWVHRWFFWSRAPFDFFGYDERQCSWCRGRGRPFRIVLQQPTVGD